MSPRKIIPLLIAATATVAARAEIEFIGVLITPEHSRFALTAGGGKPASWLALGQSFDGYTLAGYNAKTDTLTLEKDGAPALRLHLIDGAKVKSARLELTGNITAGVGGRIDISRVTLALEEETVLPLSNGLVWHVTPKRRPDGNLLWNFSVERTNAGGNIEKLAAPSVVARADQPFRIAIDDLRFEFAATAP